MTLIILKKKKSTLKKILEAKLWIYKGNKYSQTSEKDKIYKIQNIKLKTFS